MESFGNLGPGLYRMRRPERRMEWYPAVSERSARQARSPAASSNSVLTAKPGTMVLLPVRGLAAPLHGDRQADAAPAAAGVTAEGPARRRNPAESRPNADDLPVAEPVAGKKGYAKLSGEYAGFPEIDVRGLAAGTLVEIADPDTAGKMIRFRVP